MIASTADRQGHADEVECAPWARAPATEPSWGVAITRACHDGVCAWPLNLCSVLPPVLRIWESTAASTSRQAPPRPTPPMRSLTWSPASSYGSCAAAPRGVPVRSPSMEEELGRLPTRAYFMKPSATP